MFSKKDSSSNIWMSFTDLLISGLIVFMLISVTSTYENTKKQGELEGEIAKVDSLKNRYKNLLGVNSINDSLQNSIDGLNLKVDSLTGKNIDFGFKVGDFPSTVTVTDDGKIRFTKSRLFETNSHKLSNNLKQKLSTIWPIVINKVNTIKSGKNDIWEIRIEGHTDSRPIMSKDITGQGNLGLSQRRAAQTWIYIYNHLMNNLSNQDKRYIVDRIVTLGFGDKKLLNQDGLLLSNNKGYEDQGLSRRIEISLLSKPTSIK